MDGDIVLKVDGGGAEHPLFAPARIVQRGDGLATFDERPVGYPPDRVLFLQLYAEDAPRSREVPLLTRTLETRAGARADNG